MTEGEDFLTRWSRRKRDANVESKAESGTDGGIQPGSERAIASDAETQNAPQTNIEPGESQSEDVLDLSKLPSLDSIGPETDISAFLRPGIPEVLSRAALRRAWSADPGIRDFIGLSENSWDFTSSDGMHGFGELDPADAKRLLAQFFADGAKKDVPVAATEAEAESAQSEMELANDEAITEPIGDSPQPECGKLEDGTSDATDDGMRASFDVAAQNNIAPQPKRVEPLTTPKERGHGRALPQ